MTRKQRTEITSDLFFGSDALREGALTLKELRSSRFRRVLHGVYTGSGVPPSHELRCRAAAMVVPAQSVLTGRSAVTMWGVDLAGPSDPVEIVTPDEQRRRARRSGVRYWCGTLAATEYEPWQQIRIAAPERAAFDLLASNVMRVGVPAVDAMLRAGLVTLDELGGFLAERHDNGIRRARRAFPLLDGRAESLPESEVRVLLRLDGLDPEPQVEVFDEHGFVGRVDLALRAQRVAVEYEGRWHADPRQFALDERRRARLRAAGWTVVVVTAELLRRPNGVVNAVRAALREGTLYTNCPR